MRKILSTAAIVCLGAGIGALGGCAQQVAVSPGPACDFTPYLTAQTAGPVLVGPLPGTMSPLPLNMARVTDFRITNKVLVQMVQAQRTETGTVRVQARLINCTDFPLQVEGRTQFQDASTMNVEPISMWQRVYLPPRSANDYSEMSVNARRTTTFFIELREGT
jgi:hypothetical protein